MGVYGSNYDFGMSPFFKDDDAPSGASVNYNTIPLTLSFQIQQPTVFNLSDVSVDFTATPVTGSVPLIVTYTAKVIFRGSFANQLSVKEYHWFFDPLNQPNNYVISTTPTINKVYVGQLGSQFSTKLEVVLEPTFINSITGWVINSSASITWNFSDVLSNLKIELSRDLGNSWSTIIASTPNTGSYIWETVTGPKTSSALVRISGLVWTDTIDGSTIDFSNITSTSTIPFTIS